ncbi:MAG TPA: hypothetical protein VKS22_15235 [Candidatus Binataceae bacterium]|nr:hypothetical protein [Candidatus Binataceae bacterium]
MGSHFATPALIVFEDFQVGKRDLARTPFQREAAVRQRANSVGPIESKSNR